MTPIYSKQKHYYTSKFLLKSWPKSIQISFKISWKITEPLKIEIAGHCAFLQANASDKIFLKNAFSKKIHFDYLFFKSGSRISKARFVNIIMFNINTLHVINIHYGIF